MATIETEVHYLFSQCGATRSKEKLAHYVRWFGSVDPLLFSQAIPRLLLKHNNKLPSYAQIEAVLKELRPSEGTGGRGELLTPEEVRRLISKRFESINGSDSWSRIPYTEANIRRHWFQFGQQLGWPPYEGIDGQVVEYPAFEEPRRLTPEELARGRLAIREAAKQLRRTARGF